MFLSHPNFPWLKCLTFPLLLILIFASCTGEQEDPSVAKVAEEKKEFIKLLDKKEVLLYKSIKVMVRSAPVKAGMDSAAVAESMSPEDTTAAGMLRTYTMFMIEKYTKKGAENKQYSLADYMSLFKAFQEMTDEIKTMDEDQYPTLFEVATIILKAYAGEKELYDHQKLGWNKEREHLALTVMMEPLRSLPPTLRLYELQQIDWASMKKDEVQAAGKLLLALVYFENDLKYMAEAQLTEIIQDIDAKKYSISSEATKHLLPNADIKSDEDMLIAIQSISYLLRGYVRIKMIHPAKVEAGMDDLSMFLETAKKINLDNEMTWMVETYLALKDGSTDKARELLGKLASSKRFASADQKVFANLKSRLEKGEEVKAEEVFDSSYTVARVVSGMVYDAVANTPWYDNFQNSEQGQLITKMMGQLEEEFGRFSKFLDFDLFQQKGGNLLDGILK